MKKPAAATAAAPARRILVVEDDAAIRDAFAELLGFEGYVVETVADGAEALARIAEATPPDLMLLDMMMPKVDGAGVLRALQDEPRWRDVKVIVVSATQVETPLGAVGFIRKPFDPDALMALIERTFEPG